LIYPAVWISKVYLMVILPLLHCHFQDSELFKQHQLADALRLENRELFRRRNVILVCHILGFHLLDLVLIVRDQHTASTH